MDKGTNETDVVSKNKNQRRDDRKNEGDEMSGDDYVPGNEDIIAKLKALSNKSQDAVIKDLLLFADDTKIEGDVDSYGHQEAVLTNVLGKIVSLREKALNESESGIEFSNTTGWRNKIPDIGSNGLPSDRAWCTMACALFSNPGDLVTRFLLSKNPVWIAYKGHLISGSKEGARRFYRQLTGCNPTEYVRFVKQSNFIARVTFLLLEQWRKLDNEAKRKKWLKEKIDGFAPLKDYFNWEVILLMNPTSTRCGLFKTCHIFFAPRSSGQNIIAEIDDHRGVTAGFFLHECKFSEKLLPMQYRQSENDYLNAVKKNNLLMRE